MRITRSFVQIIFAALVGSSAAICAGAFAGLPGQHSERLPGIRNGNTAGAESRGKSVIYFSGDVSFFQANKQASPSRDPKTAPPSKQNTRPEERTSSAKAAEKPSASADSVRYTYEFTQPQFYIRHILIEHDQSGQGRITFERQGEEIPITEVVKLSPAAMGRILSLWSALGFLDSTENYQSDKQFPHLGTMRIGLDDGTRKRIAEFNWTNNKEASALVNEYRRVSDQSIFVFDMSIARENQPLNAPKLMELLESLLKRDGLSDSQQLVPLLKEISTDEHVPLIARNHAVRLLQRIEK